MNTPVLPIREERRPRFEEVIMPWLVALFTPTSLLERVKMATQGSMFVYSNGQKYEAPWYGYWSSLCSQEFTRFNIDEVNGTVTILAFHPQLTIRRKPGSTYAVQPNSGDALQGDGEDPLQLAVDNLDNNQGAAAEQADNGSLDLNLGQSDMVFDSDLAVEEEPDDNSPARGELPPGDSEIPMVDIVPSRESSDAARQESPDPLDSYTPDSSPESTADMEDDSEDDDGQDDASDQEKDTDDEEYQPDPQDQNDEDSESEEEKERVNKESTRTPDGVGEALQLKMTLEELMSFQPGQDLKILQIQTNFGIEIKRTPVKPQAELGDQFEDMSDVQIREQAEHVLRNDTTIKRVVFLAAIGGYWTYLEYGRNRDEHPESQDPDLPNANSPNECIDRSELNSECYRELSNYFGRGPNIRSLSSEDQDSRKIWFPKIRRRLAELSSLWKGPLLTEEEVLFYMLAKSDGQEPMETLKRGAEERFKQCMQTFGMYKEEYDSEAFWDTFWEKRAVIGGGGGLGLGPFNVEGIRRIKVESRGRGGTTAPSAGELEDPFSSSL